MLLPKLPSVGSLTAFPTIMVSHTASLWSRHSLHNETSAAMAPCPGVHWYYHGPHCFEAAGLVKQWNGPLNTQSQHQLGGETLQTGQCSAGAACALDPCPIQGAVFPWPVLRGQEWEVGMGVPPPAMSSSFVSYFHNSMLCLSRNLSWSVSMGKHSYFGVLNEPLS